MPTHIPKPGDIGFSKSNGAMGHLIRIGTWLKFHKATFNHQFVVDRVVDGVPYVIQATLHGVTDSARLDEVSPGGFYVLLPPPPSVDVEKFLFFCRKQVGVEYGVLTILAIALDLLSYSWFPSFRGARENSWECAALINEGLRFGGWYHNWISIYDIIPDEGYDALVAEGALVHVYDATEWPHYVNIPSGVELTTAPVVQAHAVSRTLHETVWTPTHPQRGSSSAEFKASKQALEKETPGCWICGKTAEQSGSPLEGHHVAVEFSLKNSVDFEKIRREYPAAKDLDSFMDSIDNLTLLCAKCHRSSLYGIHAITFPAWIVQKYQLDGWDLVRGPATNAAMAPYDDPTLYYPEH